MKTKVIKANLAKVDALNNKIDNLTKERDSILRETCNNCFTKGEVINFTNKKGDAVKGKLLYHIGQNSLSVIFTDQTKENCPLPKLILDTQ